MTEANRSEETIDRLPEDNVNLAIEYLCRQVDPHDRLNPKYAEVNRHIDALIKARGDIERMRTPLFRLHADGRLELVRE